MMSSRQREGHVDPARAHFQPRGVALEWNVQHLKSERAAEHDCGEVSRAPISGGRIGKLLALREFGKLLKIPGRKIAPHCEHARYSRQRRDRREVLVAVVLKLLVEQRVRICAETLPSVIA